MVQQALGISKNCLCFEIKYLYYFSIWNSLKLHWNGHLRYTKSYSNSKHVCVWELLKNQLPRILFVLHFFFTWCGWITTKEKRNPFLVCYLDMVFFVSRQLVMIKGIIRKTNKQDNSDQKIKPQWHVAYVHRTVGRIGRQRRCRLIWWYFLKNKKIFGFTYIETMASENILDPKK